MEETTIETIEWSAPEYTHKERGVDFLWTIGLIALVGAIIAIWFHNYVFGLFIIISGACLILFTIRKPKEIEFSIKSDGFSIGKEEHLWKDIKGFNIKKGSPYNKLLILTSKKFLPIYTIPFPTDKTEELWEALNKVSKNIELEESHSVLFMEKIGF